MYFCPEVPKNVPFLSHSMSYSWHGIFCILFLQRRRDLMENTFMKQSVPCYHVANANEAKMIQLPFGTTALLINDEAPFIYLKSSTAMGSTFRLKCSPRIRTRNT